MENPNKRKNKDGGFEANVMAILDSTGVREDRDLHDDRLSFLEAVRAGAFLSGTPSPPSWKMFDAIFQILRESNSLELTMASYQLLIDLDKHYPRVYLKSLDRSNSSSIGVDELVVVKEAWSPFILDSDSIHFEGGGTCKNSFHVDSLPIENLLLFQYLVSILEADFLPRHALYKESLDWALFRESLLNMLLGSRRLSFKTLVKECITIISKRCHQHTGISFRELKDATNLTGSAKMAHDCDVALSFSATQIERETCSSMQSFMSLIMELDMIRKEADLHGLTSRADGLRIPLLEIILDELTYNTDYISPFLEVFSEPRWKLEIVLQYFSKYSLKNSIRTRRAKESPDDATFAGILSYFSAAVSIKNIAKKTSLEVAQLLLAHAFQASLSLQHDQKHNASFAEKIGSTSQYEICNALISAFQNIRKIDEDSDITPFQKEALFTAASIVSQKS
ncbi:negative regulator of systemic acquired resistance SNI1 isoform X2 [Iris pallida]|uniref:Negative regulator of systemic acquired resistance SNI1 isoform X2 n=1 Tax=Iris pallida TaxID=29817 RepID=A0AAX6DJR8_IRIPA|nr:negative regulator of systemic acquired resistance SNI1 isoform X2 [Iris pallida]